MSENSGPDGNDRPGPSSGSTPSRMSGYPGYSGYSDYPRYSEGEPTQQLPQFQSPYAAHPGPQQPYAQQPPMQPTMQQPMQAPAQQPSAQQAYGYPPAAVTTRPVRTPRGGGVLVLAAVLAILLGGGAGYVGARLGDRPAATSAAPAPAPPASPGATPSAVGSAAPTEAPTQAPTAAGQNTGAPIPPTGGSADTVRIAERMLPSTVTIQVTVGSSGDLGSGFVLDDQGRIMTNNHVIADAATGGMIMVTFSDGHKSQARILGRSPAYDLAVIQVDDHSDLHPADLGNSDSTKVGETAIAIGSPLGLSGTVTEGIVSAINRPVAVGDANSADGQSYLNAIQTDAPINHGNSGGPLINGQGEVIGVDSAILTGSSTTGTDDSGNIGIGFAIPINQARQIGELLIRDGHATYPVIGATVTSDGSGNGVTLTEVTPGGAADEAGLRPQDIVTAIDGQPVSAAEDLIVAIRNHRPGDVVTLEYERGGNSAAARVRLGGKQG